MHWAVTLGCRRLWDRGQFDYRGLAGGGGTVLTGERGYKNMYLSTLTGLDTKE